MTYWLGFATGAVGMLVLLMILARRWKKQTTEVDTLDKDVVLITEDTVIISRFMLRQMAEHPAALQRMFDMADLKLQAGEEIVRMRGRMVELGETDESDTADD